MPTYNSEQFIIGTLRSMEAQTLLPKEVIIVDDGSSDNTVQVVIDYAKSSKFIINVLRNRKKGPSWARNFGILSAKSKFIAFLDSDDLWSSGHLEQLYSALHKYTLVGVAFSAVNFFGDATDMDKYSENSRHLVSKVLNKSFNKEEGNLWLSTEDLLKTSLKDGVPFRCQACLLKTIVFHNNNVWFDEDVHSNT